MPRGNTLRGAAFLVLAGTFGCDPVPESAKGGKASQAVTAPGLVRLAPEVVAHAAIQVQPAARGAFRTFRDFPGTVRPNEHAVADITPLVRGRVVDVYADLGQEVKAHALLAILYSSDLGLAQSAYLKANAKLYVAEQSFKRAKFLLEEKVIGQAEAQRRQGELISARAEAREARDRLLLLGMEENDIARLDRDQKIQSHVPINAPFEGRIIARNVTRGEVVETTEKLFVLADLSQVWVVANIPEKDIPYIQPLRAAQDQVVEVRVSAYPNEVFQARITYVGDVLDATTRTMQVRLELPNPKGLLKPEMFATIRVYAEPEPNVLMVPEAAVQRDRDRTYVFLQRDAQTFEMRPITVGESNGEVVKVLNGLREGEAVVTHAAFLLKSELQKKDI